jgi:CubicO group peptidase (beta-lactamase class C family)
LFIVPKTAGGPPRLLIGILVGLVLALLVTGGVVLALGRGKPEPVRQTLAQLPPRPPVVVVEDLPKLKAALDGQPRFMGAVLVARGDTVLFRQAYGPANVEQGERATIDTRYRLASISKQFTAAAILKLQDEGKLTIGDPVCKWIQPCPAAWAGLRIHHLLSHTSGIPDLMARPFWGMRRVTPATLDQLTAESERFPLQFEPGTKVAYDNAGFNLAAAIVEKASGMPFETYLRTAIFEPLGLSRTGLGDASDIAMGYANYPSGLAAQTIPNVSIVTGAGAVYSTLDDMLAWERALHRGHVLTPFSYGQMIADHAPADTPDERGRARRTWGYGLFTKRLGEQVDPAFSDIQVYHTGSWSGFRNLITWQPDADVTVIVLSNNYHQRDQVFLIAEQAMAEALGREFPTKGSPVLPAARSPDRQD